MKLFSFGTHLINLFNKQAWLWLLILCLTAQAQTGDEKPAEVKPLRTEIAAPTVARSESAYRVGERLTYNVAFSNFPSAAHVTLEVANRGVQFERETIELAAHVETLDVVNAALFSINNDYRSYIDANTGLPFRTTETRREGAQEGAGTREYNQPLGTSAIPPKARQFFVAGNYDLLSALYRVRALPLEQKTSYRLKVDSIATQLAGQYELEVRVTGREAIKTNVGTFNTVVTETRVRDHKNAPRVIVYFTDDERHVPVQVYVQLARGDLRASLVSSELPPPMMNQPAPLTAAAAAPSVTMSAPPTGTEAGLPTTGALPFAIGEQLNYLVFNDANARTGATISLQVRPRADYFGRNGIMLSANVTGDGVNQSPLPFNSASSYVDAETLLPFRMEMRDATNTSILTLDQTRGQAVSSDNTNFEFPVGTHDALSLFYALRRFRLTPPNRTAVSVIFNNRPYTLAITSLNREPIVIGNQTVPAIQLALATSDAPNNQMRLWVSDDARRLPLRLAATTPRGAFRADLAIIPIVEQ